MSFSKLPFSHPLVQEFNDANQAFREACRIFRKIQVTIGPYKDATPTEQLFYLQQKHVYAQACKTYHEARNKFQREIYAIYNPIKPEPMAQVDSEQFQFMEDVLKGDKKILQESVKTEQRQNIIEQHPGTKELKKLLLKQIAETGSAKLPLPNQVPLPVYESSLDESQVSELSSALSSLEDEIKLPSDEDERNPNEKEKE